MIIFKSYNVYVFRKHIVECINGGFKSNVIDSNTIFIQISVTYTLI